MPWPKKRAQLKLPDKGRGAKGLIVCNSWDLLYKKLQCKEEPYRFGGQRSFETDRHRSCYFNIIMIQYFVNNNSILDYQGCSRGYGVYPKEFLIFIFCVSRYLENYFDNFSVQRNTLPVVHCKKFFSLDLMAVILMYIPNDDTQNYRFCRLQLVVETF